MMRFALVSVCHGWAILDDGDSLLGGGDDGVSLLQRHAISRHSQFSNRTVCDDDAACGAEINLNGNDPANNNLGGFGPEDGPEEIRFKRAATIGCRSVDLVMKLGSDYTPGRIPNVQNGAFDGFGSITVKQGTGVDVEMFHNSQTRYRC